MFESLALGIFIVFLGLSSSYISNYWNTLINISGITSILALVASAILSDFPVAGRKRGNGVAASGNGETKKDINARQKFARNLIFVGLPNLITLFIVSFVFKDFLFDPDLGYPIWFQAIIYIGAILMVFHSINIIKYWMGGKGFFRWLREEHGAYIKWMIIFTIIYAVGLILIRSLFSFINKTVSYHNDMTPSKNRYF
ncbi:MAG: hypothetical protein FH756_20810 [Firmicutes bacterium]|nr:hypothetical protein [Bacillota bacterium]